MANKVLYRIGTNVAIQDTVTKEYKVGTIDHDIITTVGNLPGVPENPSLPQIRQAFKDYLKKVLS